MKDNNKSFAQRANAIIKKYPRAKFDKTEKSELESELSALAAEQEQFRKDNNIPDPYGKTDFDLGGGLGGVSEAELAEVMAGVNPNTQPSQAINTPNNIEPYSTSIVPSLVSGATSLIGNSLLAANADKGYTKLTPQRVDPVTISLQNERDAIERNADLSRNIATRNARTGSRTGGDYMSNVNAANVAIDRGISDSLGQSYMNEANTNALQEAKSRFFNAQSQQQADQYNAGIDAQIKANRDAYTAGAVSSVPAMMKDINAIQGQDALINSLGEDYKIFQEDYEGRKPWQRKRIVKKYIGG